MDYPFAGTGMEATVFLCKSRENVCLATAKIMFPEQFSAAFKANRIRAMDNATEGFDFPDDAIEKVAKANSVKIDTTQILPEVRASPCALHSKKDKKSEMLYLDNYNGDHISPHALKPRKPLSKSSLGRDINKVNSNSSMDVKAEKRYPPPLMNNLPRGMPSKEFVLTWLMHGSEPPGKSHFPEITEKSKQAKRSKRDQLRKSTISE